METQESTRVPKTSFDVFRDEHGCLPNCLFCPNRIPNTVQSFPNIMQHHRCRKWGQYDFQMSGLEVFKETRAATYTHVNFNTKKSANAQVCGGYICFCKRNAFCLAKMCCIIL